ncbi:hypothetical protein D1632_10605 [Chryseobacterium nematophagum]|uniref:Uncharacterized protein n=1 Tax=Chryseobacterium nematophagum TaxID=2305228 RepID=A0A3M7LBB8_9FLAO|nr:hypothetical protein [Chryseobacterium nematophagum]RMZ60033.1 hypothetical protein D1632_10605 [Chryseobacterium nematophagum]
MKDREYILLKSMLHNNKALYKNGKLTFSEYLDNHLLIMDKLKLSIIRMEKNDFDFLSSINLKKNDPLKEFKKGMSILKYNLN